MVLAVGAARCGRAGVSALATRPHRKVWAVKVWAVQVQDGVLIGVGGPLDPREVLARILPYPSFHFADVVWIQDNRRDFTLHIVPLANQPSRTRP